MRLSPHPTYHAPVVLGPEQGAVAGLLEAAQRAAAARPDPLILVTQSIEFGPPIAAGDPLEVFSWVDRATRTMVFVQAELTLPKGGAVVATSSGVYRILA
jgi:acyl-CoA thioesterase FadM